MSGKRTKWHVKNLYNLSWPTNTYTYGGGGDAQSKHMYMINEYKTLSQKIGRKQRLLRRWDKKLKDNIKVCKNSGCQMSDYEDYFLLKRDAGRFFDSSV